MSEQFGVGLRIGAHAANALVGLMQRGQRSPCRLGTKQNSASCSIAARRASSLEDAIEHAVDDFVRLAITIASANGASGKDCCVSGPPQSTSGCVWSRCSASAGMPDSSSSWNHAASSISYATEIAITGSCDRLFGLVRENWAARGAKASTSSVRNARSATLLGRALISR